MRKGWGSVQVTGDGPMKSDSRDFWPKMAQKCENFSAGIRQLAIYGNFPMIVGEMNIFSDG
jgi:hypothetical protein